MIDQWFGALNDTLDDLLRRYPTASSEEKDDLEQQWNVLKTISDDIIEAWLQFEDKMALYRNLKQENVPNFKALANEDFMGPYLKGQGYFKLHMFAEGADCFEQTLSMEPELNVARLLLAMCRMHLQQFAEAQRHFQLIAEWTDEPKLKAIAFNALGCVQAVFANLKQAQHYFQKAAETDPNFEDPRRNLESCRNRGPSGRLQLQFGSAELSAMMLA